MTIRLARVDDAAAVQRIYAPVVETTAISFEAEAPSVDEMRRRMEDVAPEYPWLVKERDGRVVGYAYGHAFSERAAYRWAVESSIHVDAGEQGRGTGRALYGALLRVLALLGYREVLAGIALPNPASVGLHESLGFVPAARYHRVGWKIGRWHDVGWWQCSLGEGDAGEPQPPRTMLDLAGADVERALGQRSAS
ncbi:MAG: N-acetyltransferase [Actinobacteria bacterium]|nr:N-acetyltransferase [Actinomycetota bacterium]